jgi:hypothetical protein
VVFANRVQIYEKLLHTVEIVDRVIGRIVIGVIAVELELELKLGY